MGGLLERGPIHSYLYFFGGIILAKPMPYSPLLRVFRELFSALDYFPTSL